MGGKENPIYNFFLKGGGIRKRRDGGLRIFWKRPTVITIRHGPVQMYNSREDRPFAMPSAQVVSKV